MIVIGIVLGVLLLFALMVGLTPETREQKISRLFYITMDVYHLKTKALHFPLTGDEYRTLFRLEHEEERLRKELGMDDDK